jgi:hypothetical protein
MAKLPPVGIADSERGSRSCANSIVAKTPNNIKSDILRNGILKTHKIKMINILQEHICSPY